MAADRRSELALAITGCALVVCRGGSARAIAPAPSGLDQHEAIGWSRRLRWLALALVPSALLLAMKTHITTDLAAVPLLWVVPLALYLLTFVVAFRRRPWLRHAWTMKAQLFVLIPLVLLFTWNLPFWVGLPLHLGGLFVSALVCHGELARQRPRIEHLTEFYFWMATGGARGGSALRARQASASGWRSGAALANPSVSRQRSSMRRIVG